MLFLMKVLTLTTVINLVISEGLQKRYQSPAPDQDISNNYQENVVSVTSRIELFWDLSITANSRLEINPANKDNNFWIDNNQASVLLFHLFNDSHLYPSLLKALTTQQTRRLSNGGHGKQFSHERHDHLRKSSHIAHQPSLAHFIPRDKNTSSLYVNWHWNIGGNEFLNVPLKSRGHPYRLIVDVGLGDGSGIICDLFSKKDLVYIGVEANLINFGVSYRNMLSTKNDDKKIEEIRNRVLLLPLGLSNESGMTSFNENYEPACGSILTSKKGGWWCTNTMNSFEIPVVRLETLLSKVPQHYSFYYLKVDVEGADHLVVYGAGSYISKFAMVSIECRPPNHRAGDLGREDTCKQAAMVAYMMKHGFYNSTCDNEDCHFIRKGYTFSELKSNFKKCHLSPFNVDRCEAIVKPINS